MYLFVGGGVCVCLYVCVYGVVGMGGGWGGFGFIGVGGCIVVFVGLWV